MVAGPESLSGAWHFEITPKRGRLHVEIRHGRRTVPDDKEILIMTLTARGSLSPTDPGYDAGLNTGHEAIVKSFKALTTEKAHQIWEPNNEK
jgi:hypothetical protein